ncbi:putative adhesin [Nocardia aurantia]|uniref:Putative adhesin Stv domain-containing protein n=1 Tax=Nocardia aurantia TaxID=2585199 RepID=A0A7K0DV44_9NOCA|nr:hypothetical protein [Nocardia aurantia]MQY29636.1 hypothetical protein [Nocardia aurantia]
MATYIISSHGEANFDRETIVPANVSVNFYTPFGKCLSNQEGFLLQSAIVNPNHLNANAIIQKYPAKALWNGPVQKAPELSLTADWNGDFKSGIVHAEQNRILEVIGRNKLLTLTGALITIAKDAAALNQPAVVHCLFCLA